MKNNYSHESTYITQYLHRPTTTLVHGRNFRIVQTTWNKIIPANIPKYILQISAEFYHILESPYSVVKTGNKEKINFEIVVFYVVSTCSIVE
jgi:hypothetical protein